MGHFGGEQKHFAGTFGTDRDGTSGEHVTVVPLLVWRDQCCDRV